MLTKSWNIWKCRAASGESVGCFQTTVIAQFQLVRRECLSELVNNWLRCCICMVRGEHLVGSKEVDQLSDQRDNVVWLGRLDRFADTISFTANLGVETKEIQNVGDLPMSRSRAASPELRKGSRQTCPLTGLIRW